MWPILVKLRSLQPGIAKCHALIAPLLVYLQYGLGLFWVFPLTVTLLPLLAFWIKFHLLFLHEPKRHLSFFSFPNSSPSFPLNYAIVFLFTLDCVFAHHTVLGRFFLFFLLLYPPVCLPICCELRINLSLSGGVSIGAVSITAPASLSSSLPPND